jgi:DMSO reductase family type II enzyme heme b subunit
MASANYEKESRQISPALREETVVIPLSKSNSDIVAEESASRDVSVMSGENENEGADEVAARVEVKEKVTDEAKDKVDEGDDEEGDDEEGDGEEGDDEEGDDEEGDDEEGDDEEGDDEEGDDEEGDDEEGDDEEGDDEEGDDEEGDDEEGDDEEGDDEEGDDEEGDEEENILGQELYDAYCARCHGFDGDGKGEASNFTYPTPRDFTSGMYKFRSTPSGDPPTDDDLKRSILVGFPGTSMFGWEGKFSDEDLEALIEYLKYFEEETFEIETEAIEIGEPPPVTDELMATGMEVFQKAKCWECHGKYGRGDGEKGWQPNFKDDWGDKIWPTNLAHAWELRNGASLEDLFRSIGTGLDGTPMPSFYDTYSEEQRWGLTYYLKSLQIERKFGTIVVIKKAARVPVSTEDALWETTDYIDLKMEGKKVFGIPFISMITNMRVRGIHTNSKVAIMLEWMDKKPDKGDDEFPPDAIRLQLPLIRNRINVWYWSASDNQAVEFNASGQQIDELTRQQKTDIEVSSSYSEGVYRLMFTRNIRTGDSDDITFTINRHIPFSVIAYDGKNREKGDRGAMSAVRYLIMKEDSL